MENINLFMYRIALSVFILQHWFSGILTLSAIITDGGRNPDCDSSSEEMNVPSSLCSEEVDGDAGPSPLQAPPLMMGDDQGFPFLTPDEGDLTIISQDDNLHKERQGLTLGGIKLKGGQLIDTKPTESKILGPSIKNGGNIHPVGHHSEDIRNDPIHVTPGSFIQKLRRDIKQQQRQQQSLT